ncbi:MAG: alpha/beta fold hydrolase [Rhodoferax sp.]|nr:alpha/beta fold hydrolase [Rhodoferax sp.]
MKSTKDLKPFWALKLAACLVMGCSLGPIAQAAASTPPPLEAFFGPASMIDAKLSPSGRWVVSLVGGGGMRDRLVLTDLEGKEPTKILTVLKTADVSSFRWVNEDWLTYSVTSVDEVNFNRKANGLLAVNRKGDRTRMLIKRSYEKVVSDRVGARVLEPDHYYLAPGAPGNNEIIVGHANFQRADLAHVTPLALDIENGSTRKLVDAAPPNVRSWLFDHQGRARLADSREEPQFSTIYWSPGDGKTWTRIAKFPILKMDWVPAYVNNDTLFVYGATGPKGEDRLYRFNFETGKVELPAWIAAPGFDAEATPLVSPKTGTQHGVRVMGETENTVWLHPVMQDVQKKIDAALPERINTLSCGACDTPGNVLVHSYSDKDPGQYFVYQIAGNSLQRLGVQRPQIQPEQSFGVQLHRTPARDGLDLPVWITGAPQAGQPPKPAIVLVHGGPWVRGGHWRWNEQAEFLASRGYVVIMPEFRGSEGYGIVHQRAGWKQWGQAMQDDVTDALRFAAQKGWADTKRVCIAGASYGGYAALMGVAKDTDQYRCAVAWVGVSDPSLMFSIHWSDISADSKQFAMPTLIGDPVKDAGMLAANSPLVNAKRIKAPVLLAYGDKDMRVPIEHGEKMRDALQANGNAPEWVVYEGEGHGWRRPETNYDFWGRVEKFLAKHLK